MSPAQQILVFIVRAYRLVLSPAKLVIFGPAARCRFTPSCSEYALAAVRKHGARRGSWLTLRRICRCHPWGEGGHDPVPEVLKVSGGQLPAVRGTNSGEPRALTHPEPVINHRH